MSLFSLPIDFKPTKSPVIQYLHHAFSGVHSHIHDTLDWQKTLIEALQAGIEEEKNTKKTVFSYPG